MNHADPHRGGELAANVAIALTALRAVDEGWSRRFSGVGLRDAVTNRQIRDNAPLAQDGV